MISMYNMGETFFERYRMALKSPCGIQWIDSKIMGTNYTLFFYFFRPHENHIRVFIV